MISPRTTRLPIPNSIAELPKRPNSAPSLREKISRSSVPIRSTSWPGATFATIQAFASWSRTRTRAASPPKASQAGRERASSAFMGGCIGVGTSEATGGSSSLNRLLASGGRTQGDLDRPTCQLDLRPGQTGRGGTAAQPGGESIGADGIEVAGQVRRQGLDPDVDP